MSIDPRDIALTDEQRRLLAKKAQETGKPWEELLEELFAKLPSARKANGSGRSLFEVLDQRGLIASFNGPTDLSTNPQHMKGFGEPRNAKNTD